MDEILLSNFMVFHDVVRDQPYDLWIGDEAWDLDYFLHENPELKTAAYAWLTDFVGWLPMPDGGEREAALTADYNADMLEQIARYPAGARPVDLRRRARRHRARHVRPGAAGDPRLDRAPLQLRRLRHRVRSRRPSPTARRCARSSATRADEQVCIVTVGGSGVGADLLRRVIASFPEAKRLRPGAADDRRRRPADRPGIAAASPTGSRSAPTSTTCYRHLAACDLAIVQGGLTTTMELTASRRPFIYFPLARHFEQNLHVRHRLERYGAGRRMDYERFAAGGHRRGDRARRSAAKSTTGRSRPAGAARAAALIAELL